MKAYHNTRVDAYREPYGAVAVGEDVRLAFDLEGVEGAQVQLRTWVDGEGETLYDMQLDDQPREEGGFERYCVAYAPKTPGMVWYQFVITDAEGLVCRYGARNKRMGGEGQLVGWEPPSFGLYAYDPASQAPVWHAPVAPLLHNDAARRDKAELVTSLLECYPSELCATAMPWEAEAPGPEAPELHDMALALERAQAGETAWFALGDDVFGFWRPDESGALTCTLFNASPHDAATVLVPMAGEEVTELVEGHAVDIDETHGESAARVSLWPFGSAILHFHPHRRLAFELEQGIGVLAHITSLPADTGHAGTLGGPARAFVDWLADAGVRYWQVLPANPTDEYGSPYAGISAFAGNVRLLEGDAPTVANRAVIAAPDDYRKFCERESDWLEPYALFMAIRGKVGAGKPWQAWPKKYRAFKPALLDCEVELAEAAEAVRRQQFAFEQQWQELRAHAHERGVRIIGDMPLYVSADSADVWAHPELFQLDVQGEPQVVAGCPPDAFAEDGQVWGNPVYDWEALSASGYDWWLRRIERACSLYDFVRLDHFIGFSRYFCIPEGEKARFGAYRLGPGYELFRLAYEKLGPLPVVAEDLGLLTPRVRGLVDACGFPGMDIVQFADGGDPLAWWEPRPHKIAYTGTHDNQTLVGYVRDRYPHLDDAEAADELLAKVVDCEAPVRIVPLQDVIGLGDAARMNVPGTTRGNWAWQADGADVKAATARIKAIAAS